MEVNRLWAVSTETVAPSPLAIRPQPPLTGFDNHLQSTAVKHQPEKHTHTVQRGETLSDISLKFLRQNGLKVNRQALYTAVHKVARANNLADPDLILPGQELDMTVLANKAEPATMPLAALPKPEPTVVPIKAKAVPVPPEAVTANNLAPMTERPGPIRAELPPRPGRPAGTGLGGPHLALKLAPSPSLDDSAAPAGPWERILGEAGALTSRFGSRKDPFTGEPDFHKGIDIAAPKGTSIRAAQAGRVIFSGWQPGYGNLVIVRHADGLETVYGHASKNLVKVGQEIGAGAKVAEVGSSGRSTGPHLHFEVRKNGRPIDPMPLLKQKPLQIAEVF
jgi:murein DD-endopeptidase MepM/ murein hydrolase activator NlpD